MHFGAAMFFTDYSMAPGDLGRALEERGFESLWAPEHSHIPVSRASPFPNGGDLPKQYYDVMDPFVTLTAAAAATKTLKVGTGVCLVQQRDPIQTAKLVASIDQVSAGRFLFGVGSGWNAEEMADHGTPFKSRHKVARERIEAMKVIWTENKAEYHGEFVNFDPMMTWPKPVQKPHPPVIVGGAFPYGARRAIRYGDGWVPHASRPEYGDVSDFLPQFQQDGEGGRPRSGVAAGHHVPRRGGTGPAAPLPRHRHRAGGDHAAVRRARTRSCRSGSLGGEDAANGLGRRVGRAADRDQRAFRVHHIDIHHTDTAPGTPHARRYRQRRVHRRPQIVHAEVDRRQRAADASSPAHSRRPCRSPRRSDHHATGRCRRCARTPAASPASSSRTAAPDRPR